MTRHIHLRSTSRDIAQHVREAAETKDTNAGGATWKGNEMNLIEQIKRDREGGTPFHVSADFRGLDVEAAFLAAEELATAVDAWEKCEELELMGDVVKNLQSALAAFRAAIGDTQDD